MDTKKVLVLAMLLSIFLFDVADSSYTRNIPSVVIPSPKVPKQIENNYKDAIEKKPNSTNMIKHLIQALKQDSNEITDKFKQAVEELWKDVVKKSRPIYGR